MKQVKGEIKVGDKVVVNKKGSEYYGRRGKVLGFDVNDGTKVLVEWDIIDQEEPVAYVQRDFLKKTVSILKKEAPFKSPQQEAYMWINHPDIAKKWYEEHGHHPKYKQYLKRTRKRKGKKTGTGSLEIGSYVSIKNVDDNILSSSCVDAYNLRPLFKDRIQLLQDILKAYDRFMIVSKQLRDGVYYYSLQPVTVDGEIQFNIAMRDVLIKQNILSQPIGSSQTKQSVKIFNKSSLKKAQKLEQGDMIKEIPLEIKDFPEDSKSSSQENIQIKKDKSEDRVKQVLEDVKRLKTAIQNYLLSSYKLKLSEEELDSLVRKVISALASIVADITTERVEQLAESTNILLPSGKK